jgi:signal transduction histidine kinase
MPSSNAEAQAVGSPSRPGPEFMAALAAVNLQRLFWLLIVGLGSRLLLLVVNHFAAARSDVLASIQWFDLIMIPPLIGLTAWLRRPGASVRLAWMLILFVTWGTLGMMVIQALTTASELGYRAIYVFGVMIVGVAYVIPPRLTMPAYALVHATYVTLLLTGDYDDRFRLASMADGTLGVVFAAGISWLLYRVKWNDFVKERTIAAQNRELERRNTEMRDLMALAAHDLRSPLQGLDGVLGIADSLVEPSATRLRRALGEGRESCRHMLSMVTRLLDAHAAEHRRTTSLAERCDARAVFASVACRHEATGQTRDIRLVVELPDGPSFVAMDAEALGQVVDNLIGNAVKFAPAGTAIEVVLRPSDTGWTGEIRDEGPGVPADEQPELFGKFRRGLRAPGKGEGGFGLGLYIARTLTVAAGGEVSYTDRLPKGAIFQVKLLRAS